VSFPDIDLPFVVNLYQGKTLAVLPIGVGKTAMDPASAAEAAKLIRPGILVPVHYNLGEEAEQVFLEHLDNEVEVKLFQIADKKQ